MGSDALSASLLGASRGDLVSFGYSCESQLATFLALGEPSSLCQSFPSDHLLLTLSYPRATSMPPKLLRPGSDLTVLLLFVLGDRFFHICWCCRQKCVRVCFVVKRNQTGRRGSLFGVRCYLSCKPGGNQLHREVQAIPSGTGFESLSVVLGPML
jgi:hypothetical protein